MLRLVVVSWGLIMLWWVVDVVVIIHLSVIVILRILIIDRERISFSSMFLLLINSLSLLLKLHLLFFQPTCIHPSFFSINSLFISMIFIFLLE